MPPARAPGSGSWRQRDPRGRSGEGRHDGDRVRHRSRRLQDRTDRKGAGLTGMDEESARRAAIRRIRWPGRTPSGGRGDLWVFGYASLIWRLSSMPPSADWRRSTATTAPWRCARASTAARPSARGWCSRCCPAVPATAWRFHPAAPRRGRTAAPVGREMPNAVYDARRLRCRTPHGPVSAPAFTLSRRSPNYTGRIDEAQMLAILRHASGRYGSTLDHLLDPCSGAWRRTASATRASSAWSRSAATRAGALKSDGCSACRVSGRARPPRRPTPGTRTREVGLGVDVDQHAGIVHFHAVRRIAGDEPIWRLVAL